MNDKRLLLIGIGAFGVLALVLIVMVLMPPEPTGKEVAQGDTQNAATDFTSCARAMLNEEQRIEYDKGGELSLELKKLFTTGVKASAKGVTARIRKNEPGLLERVIDGCKETALATNRGSEALRIISTQVFVKRALNSTQSVAVNGATVSLKTSGSNSVVVPGDSMRIETAIPWAMKNVEISATLGGYDGSQLFSVDLIDQGTATITMERVGRPLEILVEGLPPHIASTKPPTIRLKPTFEGTDTWWERAGCAGADDCHVAELDSATDSAKFVYGGTMTNLVVVASYRGKTKELPVADFASGTVRVEWNAKPIRGNGEPVDHCSAPVLQARKLLSKGPSHTVRVQNGVVSCSPSPCPPGIPGFDAGATCPLFAIGPL